MNSYIIIVLINTYSSSKSKSVHSRRPRTLELHEAESGKVFKFDESKIRSLYSIHKNCE
jgi:hypothetical protein